MLEILARLHFLRVVLRTISLVISFDYVNGASWQCSAAKSPSNGSTSCIQDQPYSIVKMTGLSALLHCGNVCNPTMTNCLAYQVDTIQQQCQLYDLLPTNWSGIKAGCRPFYCSVDKPGGVDATAVCSFPFTNNGQLFYRCVVNATVVPSNVWCYTSKRQFAKCSRYSYGYMATNETLNVTISSTVGVVPLKSVGGWLTVLSRLDTNFPTAQSQNAYINGFGNISSNFWLGLKKIYQLTNIAINGARVYKLRFELLGNNGQWKSIEYDTFYLDTAATSYTLRASSTSSGDVYDSLNSVNKCKDVDCYQKSPIFPNGLSIKGLKIACNAAQTSSVSLTFIFLALFYRWHADK